MRTITWRGWAPPFCAWREDVTMEMVNFLNNMHTKRADFVFTVDRDLCGTVKRQSWFCRTYIPAHPYATAMETHSWRRMRAGQPYPWKGERPENLFAVQHIKMFLREYASVRCGVRIRSIVGRFGAP